MIDFDDSKSSFLARIRVDLDQDWTTFPNARTLSPFFSVRDDVTTAYKYQPLRKHGRPQPTRRLSTRQYFNSSPSLRPKFAFPTPKPSYFTLLHDEYHFVILSPAARASGEPFYLNVVTPVCSAKTKGGLEKVGGEGEAGMRSVGLVLLVN
ncbi:hypothetical protein GALMADRAFT_143280 [Galerina marginata CBS 339.88]|uniref:Uncharacterized protein n=1 Tax=Galerina marginata (strain CBS 339.88) TaxID=685588 RepID=A0A067SXR2_GALM3|nr:hypothetical protein GALMADRAFT_143280 [Galerina marginata CBS 339.88]